MKLRAQFREVALDIPVEDGWSVTKVMIHRKHKTLMGVQFTKAGENPVNARMDTDKKWFIDAIPMRDYPSRVREVKSLAETVAKAALSRTP